jgi:hypothetical protein
MFHFVRVVMHPKTIHPHSRFKGPVKMKYRTQEGTKMGPACAAMHCYSENYVIMKECLQSEVLLHESQSYFRSFISRRNMKNERLCRIICEQTNNIH